MEWYCLSKFNVTYYTNYDNNDKLSDLDNGTKDKH